MIPTICTIKAELAIAQERLKFVDDSIGRSKRVGYQDFSKNGSFQQQKRIKAEEGEVNGSGNEKSYDPHNSLNESDLRKRLGGKRVMPSSTDFSIKRQKRFSKMDDELPPVTEYRRSKHEELVDSNRPSNRNVKNRDLPDVRPRLTSRVIPPQDDRTRDDVVKMQGQNKAVKERNRRIFGALLGTLSKFQKEETSIHKEQENRRAEAEKRIEEKEEKERQMLKLKREELIVEKKIQEFQVIHLQRKMERVRQFEEWMKNTEYLKKFICTRKKPTIYYLPKILSENSKERLKQTIDEVQGKIIGRQHKLEEELLEMDEAFRVKCEYLKKPRLSIESEKIEYSTETVNDQETNVENTWEATEENLNHEIEALEHPVSPNVGESLRYSENEECNVLDKAVTEEVSEKYQKENSGNVNSDADSPESPSSQTNVISPMSPDESAILHEKKFK